MPIQPFSLVGAALVALLLVPPARAEAPTVPSATQLWLLCEKKSEEACARAPCAALRAVDPETGERRAIHYVMLRRAPQEDQSAFSSPSSELGDLSTPTWTGVHIILGRHVQLITERGPLRGKTLEALDVLGVQSEASAAQREACRAD